jgi:predicted ATPase
MVIRTPDYRLRVFVSSTLNELAEERKIVRQSILKLRLAPVMFEAGARPHPPQDLYQAYLSQSQIFIGIYWQSYGWIAPGMQISGLEDEYNLSNNVPRLIYIKDPAPDREAALSALLDRIKNDSTSCYTTFTNSTELKELVHSDLALLLTEQYENVNRNEKAAAESWKLPLTNVPIPRNQLIDRDHEILAACDLLQRDDVALVTLTGTGGTGKSRLAIQIGLEILDKFKDGVFLVRLEPISDPNLVITTIAETLGIRESPGSRPIADMLKEFLRDKNVLLLLDNFEQVVEAAAFVGELLESCPGVKCLVTSRTSLRLRAEKELPVPPLAVPSLAKLTNLGPLSQYAAVELFIQRAQAVKPDFTVTNDNAPAVAEVCYRLDGLPLAIELAAARIKLLSPKGLLTRLENRFDLLRGGTRDLPERQRTLRSAIDWSYNLLSDRDKKLFRRLSIFIGGWTLEAAEEVCDINGDLAGHLADTLGSLIDNNLVILLEENDEQPRFGMLSTLHEYAFEQLNATDEADLVHYQHAQYYLDFVKKVEPLVRSAERERWRQVLLQEFGNIRSVLVWIYTTKKCIEFGQHIVIYIGMFWQFGGYIAEGRHWCGSMLELCNESTPVSIRAGLLCFAGELAWTQGDYSSSVASLEESLELCRQQDNQHLLAFTMLVRGMVATSSYDLSLATSMLQGSIELFKTIDDQWSKALALSFLGEVALFENDPDRAMAFCNQSIAIARQQGDPWCMMPSLMSFGQMAVLRGDFTNARTNFQEAVDLLRQTGDNWSLSWALNGLGHVLLMSGELNQACNYFLEALTIAHGFGNQGVVVNSLAGVAVLLFRRSKNIAVTDQNVASEMALAAHLCGATIPFISAPGIFVWADSKTLYDTAVKQLQSTMSDALWEKACIEGQSIPLDQAVSLAIQALKE